MFELNDASQVWLEPGPWGLRLAVGSLKDTHASGRFFAWKEWNGLINTIVDYRRRLYQ